MSGFEQILGHVYGLVVGKGIPFVVLLGVLIVVHEFGHFSVAKFFKIVVERFSIGFGPAIFAWTRGETEYRVAWIPLGGYVKMAGDDPNGDQDPTKIPGSFLGAAAWKRILIVLAGPAMNLILPVFIFAAVAAIGEPILSTLAGSVSADSPARAAGIRPGDRITSINGKPVSSWEDLTEAIRPTPRGEAVAVSVNRAGATIELSIFPKYVDGKDEFGAKANYAVIGVSPNAPAATLYVAEGSPAALAGFRTGDRVAEINGVAVARWSDVELAAHSGEQLAITAERDARRRWYHLSQPTEPVTASFPNMDLADLGIFPGDRFVTAVTPGGSAASAGLNVGDEVIRFGDMPYTDALSMWAAIMEDKPAQIALTVRRQGDDIPVTIPIPEGGHEKGFAPGFAFAGAADELGKVNFLYARPDFTYRKMHGASNLMIAGVTGTLKNAKKIVQLVGKLVTRQASVRDNLGGPLAMADLAGDAAQAGFTAFLFFIGHLSIVLGVMNLLPVPVLDGGHLVFFGAELITGRPVSLRVREVAQQVGVVALLALMIFVLFNDFTRLFS